jgi:hypothetical protein
MDIWIKEKKVQQMKVFGVNQINQLNVANYVAIVSSLTTLLFSRDD